MSEEKDEMLGIEDNEEPSFPVPDELLERMYECSGTSKIKGAFIVVIDDKCDPKIWARSTGIGINLLLEGCMNEYMMYCQASRRDFLMAAAHTDTSQE
jgi:hypothetical protein